MAPTSKDKKKKETKPELEFETITYVTNKLETMIEMLDSPEPKLLLRVVGTLNKAARINEANLEYMISCGLYKKLVVLLTSTDIYILRFTLSLIQKVISNASFLQLLEVTIVFMTAKLVTNHYLNINDTLIRSLSTNILVNALKWNSIISDYIYSPEFIEKIFEILKSDKNLEIACDNLELFFYVIDCVNAEAELLKCNGFSIGLLMCYLSSKYTNMKELGLKIIHKLAMWKTRDMVLALGNAKVTEAMVRILFSEWLEYYALAFEVIYVCLSEDVTARNFVRSIEFVKFLDWATHCPKSSVGNASSIFKTLSTREELLQVLFDFSAQDSAISLFRFVNEAVILNVCDLILNMMRHKYCCENMATPALMKILIEIINADDEFPMLPYGEKALKTLHQFFQCYLETVKIVHDSDCINMILDIFTKAKGCMTQEGYVNIIEIIQYFAKSEYAEDIKNIGTYQTVIDLYRDSTFEEDKLLNIMETFLDSDEFREVLLDRQLTKMIMNKIKTHRNSAFMSERLVMIKKLIAYKTIGMDFINQGHLLSLKILKEHINFNTCIADEIIETLYDLDLTIKFFYKNRLDENDKIRDNFILVPHTIIYNNMESVSVHIPIYVVNYSELLIDNTDEDDPSLKSKCNLRGMKLPGVEGSFRFARNSLDSFPTEQLVDTTQSQILEKYLGDECSVEIIQKFSESDVQFCRDPNLAKMITQIYNEFYEKSPSGYLTRTSKVSFIATRVADALSGREIIGSHEDKGHVFRIHLTKLIRNLKSNFIPIGYLRIGFQCERALLFKVICDQMRVSTTLCREGTNYYYNEVVIFSSSSDLQNQRLIQRIFIVDLMENVGNLIPADTLEAKEYLKRNKSLF